MYYKLAKPDGWDFYTGNTINYRENIGKVVKIPSNAKPQLCTSSVIHACKEPNDCFVGAKIPCSAYLVEGIPLVDDGKKFGFKELSVVSEITDLDKLFRWNYSEAINPINPLKIRIHQLTKNDIELLKNWDSVWDSVRASVWDSVWASVGDSVWASVGDSVGDSVWAYIGSLFPDIKEWKYIKHEPGIYPYQSTVDLWKRGFVPSFDGKVWRLHQGKDMKVVYELEKGKLIKE